MITKADLPLIAERLEKIQDDLYDLPSYVPATIDPVKTRMVLLALTESVSDVLDYLISEGK